MLLMGYIKKLIKIKIIKSKMIFLIIIEKKEWMKKKLFQIIKNFRILK